jgi:hypothetical protein
MQKSENRLNGFASPLRDVHRAKARCNEEQLISTWVE